MGTNTQKHHHHIISTQTAVTVGLILFVLTGVTVGIAHIDLGRLNFFIALAVASVKAFLVAYIFMNLKYDRRENAVIFVTSFVFLAIFMILSSTDLFFRGDVYVKGPLVAAASNGKSKYSKPWISTPELVAHGKEIFSVQCVSCHGAEGKGNGPAASALNPPPRNFTVAEGWKNGRKATQVFKTLKEGLPPSAMASYATLPADDRWALAQYVLTLGPTPAQADVPADFAKIGIDPTQENSAGAKEDPTIPLELAIERVTVAETSAEMNAHLYHQAAEDVENSLSIESKNGARLYQRDCAKCHGLQGEGGIKVRTLVGNPVAFVTTQSFNSQSQGLKSEDSFNRAVIEGLPGDLMPGFGNFSKEELKDLYSFIKDLARSH